MWVDIDDVRAEIRSLRKEAKKELDEEPNWYVMSVRAGVLRGYNKVEMILDDMEENYRKERNCEWIKYDSWTICPKHHDANNPYWRIPENTDKLKYCPYCGKKITIVKGE